MAKQQKQNGGAKCPVTREQFNKNAKPLALTINGQQVYCPVKQFSTGSFGWRAASDKFTVEIDGVLVRVQPGINLTVVGSKELPQ